MKQAYSPAIYEYLEDLITKTYKRFLFNETTIRAISKEGIVINSTHISKDEKKYSITLKIYDDELTEVIFKIAKIGEGNILEINGYGSVANEALEKLVYSYIFDVKSKEETTND